MPQEPSATAGKRKASSPEAAPAAQANALLRSLPAVGVVVEALRRQALRRQVPRARDADGELLTYLARRVLEQERQRLRRRGGEPPTVESVVVAVAAELERWDADSSTCRVINGTGIILHSGLGRAVLAESVTAALALAGGYVLLEVDREAGRRRKRDAFLEELLCHLTGAEAALVVNNNAGATILALAALATGREVVVSRSQMVEIGGSFRMPDVMEASGCHLKEVGTTNRSYARDYEDAIGENTGALMLVHTSNYRLVGFTEHVGIEEMVKIGRRGGVPVLHDLGSGCLRADLAQDDEPPVAHSVRAGADVVFFSGDKLIGGSQAGILVGRREWIERLRRHPLARALRIDKLTCIALETTLKLYLEPSKLRREVPTLRMLGESAETLAERAGQLAEVLRGRLGGAARVGLAAATSEMGAGTLPAVGLPTTCVTVAASSMSARELARTLRRQPLAVFTRVKDDAVWIDPRTLLPGEEAEVVAALAAALGR